MKQFDIYPHAAKIQNALDTLHLQWQQTSDYWRDEVQRKFAENHLDPLIPVVKNSLDAIARMGNVLDQAERDCGELKEGI